MAGVWGREAGKMLGSGPEGDYCMKNLLKIYHLARFSQRASSYLTDRSECGILSSVIKRGWGGQIEVSPSWPY